VKAGDDLPLIPAKIVELPTLVNPKLAFTDQFAANHAKQKTAANCAVSLDVSFVSARLPVALGAGERVFCCSASISMDGE
jgi:hypothetical protein